MEKIKMRMNNRDCCLRIHTHFIVVTYSGYILLFLAVIKQLGSVGV